MSLSLEQEIARRVAQGQPPMTVQAISAALESIGYKLDRQFDCAHMARWMTGTHAGESYPAISTKIREIDTGLSFANCGARRDNNFHRLQDMRRSGRYYAKTPKGLLEI